MSNPRPDFTTSTFWLNTAERTVRVFAWSAIAVITSTQADIVHADFKGAAIEVGIATALAFLGCLAGKLVGDGDSPSFVLPAPREGRHEAPVGEVPPVARPTTLRPPGKAQDGASDGPDGPGAA